MSANVFAPQAGGGSGGGRPAVLSLSIKEKAALYAAFILKWVLVHPRHDRFDGPAYRAAITEAGMDLVDGYTESKYSIVGVAVRNGRIGP